MDPFSDPDFIRDEREANPDPRTDRIRASAAAFFVPIAIGDMQGFLLTAKGLEALGYPGLAAEQRAESRARLEARGLLDAPAGAGDDVEAYRG